jgi:transposase-like protein
MENSISCIRCVDGHKMVKNGKTKSDKQRYLCKICQKTQGESYTYKAYHIATTGADLKSVPTTHSPFHPFFRIRSGMKHS